ncbi:MAG: DegV family protein [Mycobacterium leprae]
MTVQIVTDSSADLPPGFAAEHGVTVVPLQVLIEGVNYKDGVDLTPEQFYEKMRASKKLPQTAQPCPHDMQVAYEAAARKGPVIGVHLSSALSGTYQTAVSIARSISPSIRVFDSLTGSGGLARLIREAVHMAGAGASAEEIENRCRELRGPSRTVVLLNTLENAIKGGRVNPLAGMAAGVLGIKAIVYVNDAGAVEVIDKVRGRGRALARLLDMAAESAGDWHDRVVAVCHGLVPEEAEAFAAQVRARFHPKEIIMSTISATIGTYAAEGAILFSY